LAKQWIVASVRTFFCASSPLTVSENVARKTHRVVPFVTSKVACGNQHQRKGPSGSGEIHKLYTYSGRSALTGVTGNVHGLYGWSSKGGFQLRILTADWSEVMCRVHVVKLTCERVLGLLYLWGSVMNHGYKWHTLKRK